MLIFEMTINLRPAKIADIPCIKKLVAHYAKEKRLLPRGTAELRKFIRSFFVAEEDGCVVGTAALEIYSKKLSEVRSLAVEHGYKGRGIGAALVGACLKRARSRKVAQVMAVTSTEKFFEKQGFSFALPHEKKALFYWTK